MNTVKISSGVTMSTIMMTAHRTGARVFRCITKSEYVILMYDGDPSAFSAIRAE